jgi:hypothetical protein
MPAIIFVVLLTASLMAVLQKAFSKFASLFAPSSTYAAAPSFPSSPLPSAPIEPEQLVVMEEDIKTFTTDHAFIHVWFIIVGVIGSVVLAAVLALLAQSLMKVVGAVLTTFKGLLLPTKNKKQKEMRMPEEDEEGKLVEEEQKEIEKEMEDQLEENEEENPLVEEEQHEPAEGYEEQKEIDAEEEEDKDNEEIAKLKEIIQKQELALKENAETIAAKDRTLERYEFVLLGAREIIGNLKGAMQQQMALLEEKMETIAVKEKEVTDGKLEIEELKTLLENERI